MHLTIKERVELVLMSGADGVCYYYLNCFICFGALFMAQNVCYYYLNCFICFGALFMAQNVCYYYLNCFICFGALFMAHPVFCSIKQQKTKKFLFIPKDLTTLSTARAMLLHFGANGRG